MQAPTIETLALQVAQLITLFEKQAASIERLEKEVASVVTVKRKEAYYQDFLERQLGGQRLVIPGIGITDVTTDNMHCEIKSWIGYHQVPGQLSKYNLRAPRRRLCVYFFGPVPSARKIETIEELMQRHGIEMYSIDENDAIVKHGNESYQHALGADLDRFNEWLQENVVAAPGYRVHIHRFENVYMAETGNSLSKGHVGKLLRRLGYDVPETKAPGARQKDVDCCKVATTCVKNVNVKNWFARRVHATST